MRFGPHVVRRLARFLVARHGGLAPGIVFWLITIDLLVQEAMGASHARLSRVTLLGVVTGLAITAVMRTTDEIKDIAVDRVHFPDRPLVTGQVSVPEVNALTFALVALVLLVNLVWPLAILEVLLGLVFLFLMAAWYFAPQIVSKNRVLAIASNCPAFFFMCFQQAQLTARYHGLTGPAWVPAAVSVLEMLPMLSCEFARKTFLPQHEMSGYQSYSALLGLAPATWSGLLLAAAHLAGLGLLYAETGAPSLAVVIGQAVLLAVYVVVALRVVRGKPIGRNGLASAAGAYFVGGMVLVAIDAWTR